VDDPDGRASIAFLCAMPMELRPLARKLSLHRTEMDGVAVSSGSLGGRPVVAVVTGMGTALARAGSERLLGAVPVEHVVVVGIAGAVDPATPIGALIVPEVVVDGGTGAEYRPVALGPVPAQGWMWTSDRLTTDPGEVARLRSRGVVALDMETAAVAEVCERHGIPWSVFRVISDRATDGTVDDEVFHLSRQDGTPDGRAVARYFLRHPARIPRMVGLANGARLATRTAADAAVRACGQQ
jgi:adenosylhomocysteine nucleosidase